MSEQLGSFESRTPEEKVEYFREKATKMQQLAYQLDAEKKSVVLENWQLKQENQLLRDENSELKLPKPPPPDDDDIEPAESLEKRLDFMQLERRLTELEDWRRRTFSGQALRNSDE